MRRRWLNYRARRWPLPTSTPLSNPSGCLWSTPSAPGRRRRGLRLPRTICRKLPRRSRFIVPSSTWMRRSAPRCARLYRAPSRRHGCICTAPNRRARHVCSTSMLAISSSTPRARCSSQRMGSAIPFNRPATLALRRILWRRCRSAQVSAVSVWPRCLGGYLGRCATTTDSRDRHGGLAAAHRSGQRRAGKPPYDRSTGLVNGWRTQATTPFKQLVHEVIDCIRWGARRLASPPG